MNTSLKTIFNFMLDRIQEVANENALHAFQAFPRWFAEMYYSEPHQFFISDGAHDGKIDLIFKTSNNSSVFHHVINSKFTQTFNQNAPAKFYDEIISFSKLFTDTTGRHSFLYEKVKAELRKHYNALFEAYDYGMAELVFLTNYRKNDGQFERVSKLPVKVFHLDELVQHVQDDIDGAMPRTANLHLTDIGSVLSPHIHESGVSTSIIFAKIVDFIDYMKSDPCDLLFARNV